MTDQALNPASRNLCTICEKYGGFLKYPGSACPQYGRRQQEPLVAGPYFVPTGQLARPSAEPPAGGLRFIGSGHMPIANVSDAENGGTATAPKQWALTSVRLDHWPAAGGGLLVSATLPAPRAVVGGQAPDFHLTLASSGRHSLSIAYADFPDQAQHWVWEIVCDELSLADDGIDVLASCRRKPEENRISGDLLMLEWTFRATAAAAKTLLLLEAAELWGTRSTCCALRDGVVIHADRKAAISALAAGAAFQVLPPSIILRCGRAVASEARLFRSSFIKSSRLSSKMRRAI